jgi:hypothetical protein
MVVGCSSAPARNPALIAGFDPPAPAQGQIQVLSPVDKAIPAGTDITYCSYIANPFGREVDVVDALGFQSRAGHHSILMAVSSDTTFKPGDTHVCTDKDMNRARYVAGGGADVGGVLKIPDGVGFRVSSNATMLIQSHWINTGSQPLDGQSAFNVTVKDPSPDRKLAQLFVNVATAIDVMPHGTAHAVAECTFPRDMQFFTFFGHEHEFGTHVTIERVRGTMTETLYDQVWKPEYTNNPPQNTFTTAAPLTFLKGDKVRINCDWGNTTDQEIVFPREMCVAAGMQFPATTDVQCIDGVWQESQP